MVTTLYLVRHCEADGNLNRIFQGHFDGDISERGILQLEKLKERFKEIKIDAVYSSPLIRAYKTALAVNYYHNFKIITLEGLKEINGGVFEGNKWEMLETLFPESYALWEDEPYNFAAEGGESMREVYSRIRDTIMRIIKENAGKQIAVVSHGCAIKNFLCFASGYEIERIADIDWCDNTAISKIEFNETFVPNIIYQNDAEHINDDISTFAHQLWWRKNKSERSG